MSDSMSSETSAHLTHDSSTAADQSSRARPQHTLRNAISCRGISLHQGVETHLILSPADAGTGIQFQRLDLPGRAPFRLQHDHIATRHLSTVAVSPADSTHSIATIEHLMAALYAMGVDNILIQVDGPELPILDGSADAYCFLLNSAGYTTQKRPRRQIDVCQPIEVTTPDGAFARLLPRKRPGLKLSVHIDFPASIIGEQHYQIVLERSLFLKEVAASRTFVNYGDVAALQAQGMALGGSLRNALVVEDGRVLNPEGLRQKDEFVRHKTLDAIGDLYCSGYRLHGRFEASKTGHTLNNRLLCALFSSKDNWRFISDKRRLSSYVR